jgi:signal transduction histidine kinase/ActR/RegA family two-component response regulator
MHTATRNDRSRSDEFVLSPVYKALRSGFARGGAGDARSGDLRVKAAVERVALIDECDRGEKIAKALVSAGYDVEQTREGEALDGIDIVIRVALRRSHSGVAGRLDTGEEDALADTPLRHTPKIESVAHLAGGIAHDFNNILSVISICADEMLEDASTRDVNRECLVDIRHAVERGSALTRDLLSFSCRDVQEHRVVDFNDVVADAQRSVARLVGADVTLQTHLGAVSPCVRVDPAQWSSVFVNLALNARDAMPNGGTLTVRTREAELDPASRGIQKPKGTFVELEVTDTGCGVPEAIRERIFEPFFSTKGIGRAKGLGLSVVYGVVERSGGWIEVTSKVGVGTTFHLYVPLVDAPPASKTISPTATKSAVTLLLVEDEEAVRRVAHKMLTRAGYRVFQASSAEEALAMASDIPTVDALVTDVVLPGMDGRRLADALTRRYPNLEVLYTSGYTDDAVLRFGISQSELFFLQKPYTTKLLVQRVHEVLEKAQRRRR